MRSRLLLGLMAVVVPACLVAACSSSSSSPDGGVAGNGGSGLMDCATAGGRCAAPPSGCNSNEHYDNTKTCTGAGSFCCMTGNDGGTVDAGGSGGAAGQDASAGTGGAAGTAGTGGTGGAAGSGTGLFISDIHFNPLEDKTIVDTLAQKPASQWDSVFATSTITKCATYVQDTNFPLLQSALAAMTQRVPNPDIIFISGDLLVHDFQTLFNLRATDHSQAAYEAFVNTTEEYLALKLTQTYPNAQITPTLGDWDTSGGTTATYATTAFLTSYASAWSDAVNRNGGAPDFQTTFSNGGYYSTTFPVNPYARLIGLYTQPWAAECTNGCGPDGGTLGTAELQWLTDQLVQARGQGQRVWLIGHIPPGIDPDTTASNTAKGMSCSQAITPFWSDSYSNQLYALFSEYRDILTFGIFAHEHYDDLRSVRDSSGNLLFAIKLVPSITPLHNNPTFMQFNYDPTIGEISDTTTWYLSNLASSPTATTAVWEKEYSFDATYGQTAFDSAGLNGEVNKILTVPATQATFVNYYPSGYAAGDILEAGLVPFLSWGCALHNTTTTDFTKCYCPAVDSGTGDGSSGD